MGKRKKTLAALMSVFSNSLLILLKVITGLITGSVSIISEAIHSAMDLLASFIAFFSVRTSDNPPDKEHPYGHGKFENISGAIEAILIFIAAIIIIYKAVKKLIVNEPVESLGIGFFVMIFSAIVNTIVASILYRVAKKEDSVALAADALHLKVDVYTSIGVGLGLGAIWLIHSIWDVNLYFLDPVIALMIALIIIKEAWSMFIKAYNPLIDTSLSDEELKTIHEAINKFDNSFIDYHQLRTRKAGKYKYIDLHLTVRENMPISESHELCNKIEKEIEEKIENSTVIIHVEPDK
jgi:cation diffusion facilitator family transporter